MSDRPGITQKLRDSMKRHDNFDGTSTVVLGEAGFDNLCDQIDAIHAALEAENERLRQDVAICSESEQEKCIDYLHKENIDWEDKYLHVAVENARLREQIDTLVIYVESDGTKYSVDCDGNQHFDHSDMCVPDGWIELPKDANGEYIHIGDVMECEKLPNGNRVCGEVKAIGGGYVWLMNVQYKIHAGYLHHWHPDTWERIIEDARFGFVGTKETDEEYVAALVARCKALASDAE